MFDTFAELAFRLPLRRTFTYRVPPELTDACRAGSRVLAEIRGRTEEAIVTELHQQAPDFAVLPLRSVIDPQPILNAEQLALAAWLAEHYLAGIGECLFKMFPGGKRPAKRQKPDDPGPVERPDLNSEQQAALDRMLRDLPEKPEGRSEQAPAVHLLHGITGSGKTEVYIRLIQQARERDLGVVLLVPEIALTVQLITRLREVFGSDLVLLHSALRRSARLRGYLDLLDGTSRIAVGTRSAVFAPVGNPGLFILDEEHDGSYKEHSAPRYHARQVAYHRAGRHGGLLLLGSATPSLESRFHAEHRPGFGYHRLTQRATGAALPEVRLVKISNPDVPISGDLLLELERTVKAGHQGLLLLNRRGYFPFLYCPSCQASLQCPNCSVTLNHHRDGRLMCHYCAYARRADGSCDRCRGPVRRLGSGTQKLEEYLLNLYPQWRIERLDTDASSRVNTVESAIGRLLDHKLDVLLGTQMIAKGLDAPNVTLVGVLQADLGLNLPDFRAAERTFSLLTQVAGRAGRGDFGGRVLFEVLDPRNPVVERAQRQDYESFYAEELALRRALGYPPFGRLVRLLCRSESEEAARVACATVAATIEAGLSGTAAGEVRLLGPTPAPMERLHGQFRHHLVIKTSRPGDIRAILSEHFEQLRAGLKQGVHLEIDFDPVDLA